MEFYSLHDYIHYLERNNQLIRISESVSPILEITEITDRISKQEGGGKAILFENTGTGMPVLTNMMGSVFRMNTVLRVNYMDEVTAELDALIITLTKPGKTIFQKFQSLPEIIRMGRCFPKQIKGKGKCQDVVIKNPDLNQFPILKCWPYDGGKFITLPIVITVDPETGIRNAGMYRMQVLDNNTTGMHWHQHKTGARHYEKYKKLGLKMPVAVALGGDPLLTYAATAPLPEGIDEFLFAGFIRKRRVSLVKCITQDIYVPSEADIILEGFVDPSEELVWEGPFGDHTGFYSLADWYPKFHITCITTRKNPVYPATIVGIPPQEDAFIARATTRIFLWPIQKTLAPEIVDMHLPDAGVAHNIAMVSVDPVFPGQVSKVANALWGAGQMMFNKILLVVPTAFSLTDYISLIKYACNILNFEEDLHFGYGPLDVLDHSSQVPLEGSKVCIDLTHSWNKELKTHTCWTEPDKWKMLANDLKSRIYGVQNVGTKLIEQKIPVLILSINSSNGLEKKNLAEYFTKSSDHELRIIVLVDSGLNVDDLFSITWMVSANMEPKRDIYLIKNTSGSMQTLILDGTRKTSGEGFNRQWPNVVIMDEDSIKNVNQKWNNLNAGNFLNSPSLQYVNCFYKGEACVEPEL